MSDCKPFVDLILTASVEQLDEAGSGPLAAHLRACRPCAAAARAVRAETRELADRLAAGAPAPDIDALVERALATPRPSPVRPRPSRDRRSLAWAGLAAAAALAAVVLRPAPPPFPPPERPTGSASAPLVESADRDFALVPTTRSDLAIVWLFPKEATP